MADERQGGSNVQDGAAQVDQTPKEGQPRTSSDARKPRPRLSEDKSGDVFGLEEGKGLVDALTSNRRGEAHQVWANMNLSVYNVAADPAQKEKLLDVIIDNVRDPEYRDALADVDYAMSLRVGRIVQERKQAVESQASIDALAVAAPDTPPIATQTEPSTALDGGAVAAPAEATEQSAEIRAEASSGQTFADQPAAPATAASNSASVPSSENSIEPVLLAPEIPVGHDTRPNRQSPKNDATESVDDLPKRAASVRILEAIMRPFRRAASDANELAMPAVMTKVGYAMPDAIASRYIVLDGSFWQFDPSKSTQTGDHKPTFLDHGPRLATSSDDRGTVADMLTVAQAKGWQSVTLKGSEPFRRAAWLEATLSGVKTQGFTPKEQDHAMLDAARRERDALTISSGRQASAAVPRQTGPVAPTSPKASAETPPQPSTSQADPAAAEREAARAAQAETPPVATTEKVRPDVLLAHGKAPYQHDDENSDSYFVTVRESRGSEKTVWGLDLERAIADAKVVPGDAVSLENRGSQEVLVQAPVKNEAGKTIGFEEKVARRNVWEVTREAAERPESAREPATAIAMDVATLRTQIEDAIKDQPDNVKRAVLDRLAERLEAGLAVQAAHARTGAESRDLPTQIKARVDLVDAERVARTTIEQAAAKRVAPRPEVAKPSAPTVT